MFDRPHSDVNPVIARRRELEDKRATLQATLEKNNKLSHVATWENRNEHVFIRSQVKQAAIAARKAAEDNLSNRRSRLARLMAEEEAVFKQEILAMQETPEQKAARMSARAREIKAAKEAKRQEVAEDAYYRQWRAQTDEMRTLDSQKALETAARGRKEQLEQMRMDREKAKLEEQRWAAQWDAERVKKEQREQADALRAQATNSKTRDGLDHQLRELSARKEHERAQRMAEMEALERHMAAEAEAQREAERKKLEDAHRKNRELTEFNVALQARKDAEARQKAAEDLAFLQNDIDLHRQETQAMLEEKMRLRMESEAYRAFLAERRANEAAMERELERLIQQELDRVNLEQDRKRMKEDEARQLLMKDVQVERQRQLQALELGKSLERHVKLQDRQAVDADVQRYLEEQRARESARKRNEEQRRIEIERQIFGAPSRHEQRQAAVREEQALERQAAAQQSLMWEKEKQKETASSRSDSRNGTGTFGRKGANWYS